MAAVSLNSVVGFSSTKLQTKYQTVSTPSGGASIPKLWQVKASSRSQRKRDFSLSVSEDDRLTTEAAESSASELSSSPKNGSPSLTTTTTTQEEKPKRSVLTARERVRAARVLSRYNTETSSKPRPKPDFGSKVLEALRESDRGRKKGLPEAPGNMLDDSKRGMPPKGLTFDFPGGSDLFFIIFSFVFISTVMFATTFIVWKVGAIHFNEY